MKRRADHVLFAHIAGRDEAELDLGTAALLVGEIEHPDIDVSQYLARLDDMAEVVLDQAEGGPQTALPGGGSARARGRPSTNDTDDLLAALVRHLFDDLAFEGNDEDYYDPQNSFLHRVMDRRLGIPITLSTLFLEVGWRVGLDAWGIAFPGHFLVSCRTDSGLVILDPFHRGSVLEVEDLEARLERVFGKTTEVRDEHLEPASKKQILTRILNNLRLIYQKRGDGHRELAALERMAILNPRDERLGEALDTIRKRQGEEDEGGGGGALRN